MNEELKNKQTPQQQHHAGIKRLSTEAKTIFVSIYNLCKGFFL